MRSALSAWRASAEETAERLAAFWLRWQVQAPLHRTLRAWRAVAAEQRSERALSGMAQVHRERQLLQSGLAAFAGNASQAGGTANGRRDAVLQRSPRSPAGQQPVRLQQQHEARHHAQQQQQQQRQQPAAVRTRTTITVSHGRAASAGQEQRAPAAVAQARPAASGGSCAAEAESSVLAAVSDWRAAADYWRQRHERFAAAQQQQQQHAPAQPLQPAAVGPHTAATLQELRVRWQQLH